MTVYDAVLVVAFGGPEGPDDVLPFLENVLLGKNVPRERMLAVAEHYQRFGGKSPINDQIRALVAALVERLNAAGPPLPVYWGNRNWHPLLADTLRQMAGDGVRNAIAFFTSPYSSYSSCRQYLEDIERARAIVGPNAPQIDKLRAYYNHPGFIDAMTERVAEALAKLPAERRESAPLFYTAHSIPLAMARGCRYEVQLREACRLVSERLVSEPLGRTDWRLVYQSRSGPPSQPWLEPDIGDALRELAASGNARDVVVVPIGFISDHVEVLYDLDTEAANVAKEVGVNLIRAATVGSHPTFVEMIRQLIHERTSGRFDRPTIGRDEPVPDVCPADCCPARIPNGNAE